MNRRTRCGSNSHLCSLYLLQGMVCPVHDWLMMILNSICKILRLTRRTLSPFFLLPSSPTSTNPKIISRSTCY
uniref:Uncharacterized protein n=1 Tax=Solanum lycopersicum TaxID=4081 RepID=A0A3Q7H686_SOLLC